MIAQAAWALWAHREVWRGVVVANLVAAIGFLPWLSEFLDDSESPLNVLPLIHPFGLETATSDIAQWSVEGYPYPVGLDHVDDPAGTWLVVAGLVIAIAAVAVGFLQGRVADRGMERVRASSW